MDRNWIIFVDFILIYFVGFVGPVSASTWKKLFVRFLICLGIAFGLLHWAGLGGGFSVFVFSFPILFFAAGAVSGVASRATLLALQWHARSGKGALAILVGMSALPVGKVAHDFYRDWESRALYAELPTAETLPAIPACSPFRQTGPLIGSVLTARPSTTSHQTIPKDGISIRYPAIYREPFPPRFPKDDERSSVISFQMYVQGALPNPPEDDRGADGKWIRLDRRQPSIRFDFRSRAPIGEYAIRLLNITSGKIGELNEMPELRLSASSYRGLSLVVSPQPGSLNRSTKSLVAMHDGTIDELVQCSGKGTFPHCSFSLDESGITLEGTFAETSLIDWPVIRHNVRSFASCSVVAARPGAG
jgi:hypothetical protein